MSNKEQALGNPTDSNQDANDSEAKTHTHNIIESTAGRPNEIQAIDKTSVHRICSGQVCIEMHENRI